MPFRTFDPMGQSASLLKCGRRARLKHRAQLAACQRCQEALAEGKSGYEAGPGTPELHTGVFQDLSEFFMGRIFYVPIAHVTIYYTHLSKTTVCQIFGLIWAVPRTWNSHIYQHSYKESKFQTRNPSVFLQFKTCLHGSRAMSPALCSLADAVIVPLTIIETHDTRISNVLIPKMVRNCFFLLAYILYEHVFCFFRKSPFAIPFILFVAAFPASQ